MVKKGNLDKTLATLGALNPTELLRVKLEIEALLEIYERQQTKTPLEQAIADKDDPDAVTRGRIEFKLIPDKKTRKKYGPYKYRRYWDNGTLRSVYLGKASEMETSEFWQSQEGQADT